MFVRCVATLLRSLTSAQLTLITLDTPSNIHHPLRFILYVLRKLLRFGLFVISAVLVGTPLHAQQGKPQKRHFRTVVWDTVMLVGGTVDDTVIQDPIRIAASHNALFVFDHGRSALTKIDLRGKVEWIRGRRGAGPAEYRKVRDIAIGSSCVFVMDAENARIAKVDIRTGVTLGYIQIQKLGFGEWVREIDKNTILVITAGQGAAANLIDTLGVVTQKFPLALPNYSNLDGIASQVVVSVTQRPSPKWIAGYLMSDWWASYNNSAAAYTSKFVDDIPEAVVKHYSQGAKQITAITSAVFSVRGIYDDGQKVMMLYGGSTKLQGRVLDYYDSKTGRYVESRVLPVRLSRFAVRGNQICGVTEIDDVPAIICLAEKTKR